MRAKGDLNAEAAIIDGNDIDLEAEEGELNIEAMQEQHEINNSHEMLTTTVKYRVGNSYTDTVNASIATAENIKQAKKALEHLNEMREQFEQGRVSRRALRNAEENFAIISANIGMSTLQITKAVSNAAGTTLICGMYTTVDVETSGSRETMELQKTTNVQGSITGNKIRIKSGKNAKIQTNISSDTSTEIKVKGDLSLESTQDTNEQYVSQKQLGFALDAKSVSMGSRMSEYTSKQTNATSLKSKGVLDVTVDGNLHLKGSNIDTQDESKLHIKAKSMSHEDLENEQHDITTGFQIQTGFGERVLQGTTTFGLTDKETIRESTYKVNNIKRSIRNNRRTKRRNKKR